MEERRAIVVDEKRTFLLRSINMFERNLFLFVESCGDRQPVADDIFKLLSRWQFVHSMLSPLNTSTIRSGSVAIMSWAEQFNKIINHLITL